MPLMVEQERLLDIEEQSNSDNNNGNQGQCNDDNTNTDTSSPKQNSKRATPPLPTTSQAFPKTSPTVDPTSLGPISSSILYSLCSVSMVLINKSLASSYHTDFNLLLVLFQSFFAIIFCSICKQFQIVDYPALNPKTSRQWLPVNIFFISMLFSGMAALQHNTVPMVTVFKNVANIFIAGGDFLLFKARVDKLTVLAFAIMLFGAMAASFRDASVSLIGLTWMLANCLATAGYVLYMKHATATIKLSKWGMV